MYSLLTPLLILVALGIVIYFYQSYCERELVRRLKQLRHDPTQTMMIVDEEIEFNRQRAEYWKKNNPHRW